MCAPATCAARLGTADADTADADTADADTADADTGLGRQVQALEWGMPEQAAAVCAEHGKFDLVLLSDCTYGLDCSHTCPNSKSPQS